MLTEKRLWSLTFTNFFGVLNDNAFKIASLSLIGHSLSTQSEKLQISSIIMILFNLPFILFPTVAGWVGDRFSRSTVIRYSKCAELIIMSLGSCFLYLYFTEKTAHNHYLLATVFLMALQSVFFSPAKSGLLPQLFSKKEISKANGLLELFGLIAIIIGTGVAPMLISHIGLLIIFPVFSLIGLLISFKIPYAEAQAEQTPFPLNPFADLWRSYRKAGRVRGLRVSIWGESFFFMIGQAILVILLSYVTDQLILNGELISDLTNTRQDELSGYMLATLALGMGLGCFAAGKLSRQKVELGLVPLGCTGLALSTLALYFCYQYNWSLVWVATLGLSAGLFVIPLKSYIQEFSPKLYKGRILALSNFLSFSCMLGITALIWFFSKEQSLLGISTPAMGARELLLACFGITLAFTVGAIMILPDFLFRFVVVTLTRTIYRMDIVGSENIPERGPVLLLPNHVTWVDGLLISAAVSRPVRFMILDTYYNKPYLKPIFQWMGFIPVPSKGRKAIKATLERGKAALQAGEVLCIFPEGKLTRSGVMNEFKSGFTRMLPENRETAIVPTHLGMIWGSIFSKQRGEALNFRLPDKLPYPMTVSFGTPLETGCSANDAREAVAELEFEVEKNAYQHEKPIHSQYVELAHKRPFRKMLQDSDKAPVSNIQFLIKILALRNTLEAQAPKNERYIGLMLPTCTAGIATALSTMMSDKVPVFLNFTAQKDSVWHAIRECKMKRILTSRLFQKKVKFEFPDDVEVIYLEELAKTITSNIKIKATLMAMLPAFILKKKLFPNSAYDLESEATVLFSSGSTGTPKGVVLTHHNFTANLSGLLRIIGANDQHSVLGTMPLFHCFGFLSAFWMPILNHNKIVFHPNPLEAAKIGDLIKKHKLKIMLGTPTFLSAYARKCTPDQLSSLEVCLSGAEKLRDNVAEAFYQKAGIYPIEAYGATELSPTVSVNVPNEIWEIGKKRGAANSVGHPIPGVGIKVCNPDTGECLPMGSEGLLFVKGPGVMKGYLNQVEKTAEVLQDGWYNTGDMAKVDDQGYISLTGRLSRFSKIAGEMVPHGGIEEAIHEVLESSETKIVITSRPCSAKGEKIIALYTEMDFEIQDLLKGMKERGLPNLWIPKAKDFVQIDEFPLLGSGKLDLQKLKNLDL